MTICGALGIGETECIAVIGCGGKSALIRQLAQERARGGVLVAPTTRIAISQVEKLEGIGYLGCASGEKYCAAPLGEIERASRGFALTLMEADGSRCLPLKGWADHEPVVPLFATMAVGVVSARAVGLAATAVNVHRLPLFLQIVGMSEADVVSAEAVARMILHGMERCHAPRRAIWINQVEDEGSERAARDIAAHLAGFSGTIAMGTLLAGGKIVEA